MTVSRSLDGVLVVRSGLHVLLLSPPSVAPLSRFARGTKSRVDVWMLRAIIRLPDIAGVREWWSATSPHGHRRTLSDDQVLTDIGHAIASGELVAIVASSAPVTPLRIIPDRATTSARLQSLASSSAKASDNRYRVGQTMEQRLQIVVGRAVSGGRLGPELKRALLDLISPVNIAIAAATMAGLAVAHATGLGEAGDTVLAAYIYFTMGMTGVEGLAQLIRAAWLTSYARSDDDLDRAADLLVQGITKLGVAGFLTILGRFGKRGGGGAGSPKEGGQATAEPSTSLGSSTYRSSQNPQQIPEPLIEKQPPGEDEKLSPFTQRYLTESGGRFGSSSTRAQNYSLAQDLESDGFEITGGGGMRSEEYIPGIGPGTRGATFVDITARAADGSTVRVQTIDTLPDGFTPTPREIDAAARIRAAFPDDELRLIPKGR